MSNSVKLKRQIKPFGLSFQIDSCRKGANVVDSVGNFRGVLEYSG